MCYTHELNVIKYKGGNVLRVYLNNIHGVDDAILSMFMSKRSWTPELQERVQKLSRQVLDKDGFPIKSEMTTAGWAEFNYYLNKVVKWGSRHMTMLRFIDLSFTVEGLHYAGTGDWDSHSMRFNNRIIRSSTRLANFDYEMSDYYQDKIIPTDMAMQELGIGIPDRIERDGQSYVKTINGYIREDLQDNKDVKRGLYMLSIPSNFIFKVNLTEFAHVYKERNMESSANPEVKMLCEMCQQLVEDVFPQFNKELLLKIPN